MKSLRFVHGAWAMCAVLAVAGGALAGPPRVTVVGSLPNDARLGPPKDLNGYFPFTPVTDPAAWEERAAYVRKQLLVALGLWPMPEPTPVNAVVHGLVERDDFTVERVFFESLPGFYVTGSLFRPKGYEGPRPLVLCPHGHWANGRFYDAGPEQIKQDIVNGAERFQIGGRYPLQSRCIQLARMGCIVFHYDMIGYADSTQIPFEVAHRYADHRPELDSPQRWGLFGVQAELRLQSILGLQTYNSIRALDWLTTLPEVDATRIGVTGASGGGTQTFLLCAIDPRPAVAHPAVMVSTAMQGGCTCENCSLLRIDTGNIEFAALFAPKPLSMTAANDWTVEIMTKGFPELQQQYAALGAPDNVMCAPLLHFPHNYNYVSRAVMYRWFNKHLGLGFDDPVIEEDFQPLSRDELTVWTAEHPAPAGGIEFEAQFCGQMAAASDAQLAGLAPRDAASLESFRHVVGGAWEAIVGHGLPKSPDVQWENLHEEDAGDYLLFAGYVRSQEHGSELPTVFLLPKQWNKQVVVWVDEEGKAGLWGADGALRPEVQRLLNAGCSVAAADLLQQGESLAEGATAANRRVDNPRQFAGYTFGYNHPLFCQRVHDVLTLVALARSDEHQAERVHLVGLGGAGRWVAAAAALAGPAVERAVVDTAGFRFANARDFSDPEFVPGALKYGDLPSLLALRAPHPLWLSGEETTPELVGAAYAASGEQGALAVSAAGDAQPAAALDWLLQ